MGCSGLYAQSFQFNGLLEFHDCTMRRTHVSDVESNRSPVYVVVLKQAAGKRVSQHVKAQYGDLAFETIRIGDVRVEM